MIADIRIVVDRSVEGKEIRETPRGLVVLDSDIMSPKRAIIQVRIDGVWCEVPIVDSTHV